VALIDNVTKHHHERIETYRTAARQLAWNFSIHNPANIAAWIKIFEEGIGHQKAAVA
jgi:hypothetical protein